jgi:hypothetical protein
MPRIMLIATVAILINSAASAQTKDQCATVSVALLPMLSAISPMEKGVANINWNQITSVSAGEFRNSAEAAKQAQIVFLTAARQYRIALEDVAHQAQLCAR